MTIAEKDLIVDESFDMAKQSIYFATSKDGKKWTLQNGPVAHYASVPDLVNLNQDLLPFEKGTLLTYFVDGVQGHGTEDLELGLIYSLDLGKTWSDRLYTSMTGAPAGTIVVDPSVIQLEDGRLRLYFFDFRGKPGSQKTYKIHSAISENGIDFVYESVVYENKEKMTDPEIVYYNNEWYLFTASQTLTSMQVAISDDPLSFGQMETLREPGIPGALAVDDTLWIIGCGSKGMTLFTSKDGTTTTLQNENLVQVGAGVNCDPSPVQLANGTFAMMFKFLDKDDATVAP